MNWQQVDELTTIHVIPTHEDAIPDDRYDLPQITDPHDDCPWCAMGACVQLWDSDGLVIHERVVH